MRIADRRVHASMLDDEPVCFTPESPGSPTAQADDAAGRSLNVQDLDLPNLSSGSLTVSEADEENRLIRRARYLRSAPSLERASNCAPRTNPAKLCALVRTVHTGIEQLAGRVCAEMRSNSGHAPNVFVKISTVEHTIHRNVAILAGSLADLQRQLLDLNQGPTVAASGLNTTADELKRELAHVRAELELERQRSAELLRRLERQFIGEDVRESTRVADERMERKARQIDVLTLELQTLCTHLHTTSQALDKRFDSLREAEEVVKRREIVATSREAYIKMRSLQSPHPATARYSLQNTIAPASSNQN